jgi:hypothetical protein
MGRWFRNFAAANRDDLPTRADDLSEDEVTVAIARSPNQTAA